MILGRRKFISMASGMAITSVLGGCSQAEFHSGPAADSIASRRIFVATNRNISPDPLLKFNDTRSKNTHFLSYDISIPPDRKPGEFSFPQRDLDPSRQFFVSNTYRHEGAPAFSRQVASRLDPREREELGAILFVHGFNVSYASAVFRTAQIATDFGIKSPMSLFSWPSAGRVSRYAYDRDSVLHARIALTETIEALAKQCGKVTIIAHSVGCFLTMEVLKRLTLLRENNTLQSITSAILVQPDIDVDVFLRQMDDIRSTDIEIAVIGSRNDRALKVSNVLTGGHPRVGEAENIEALRQAGVTVIDVSGSSEASLLGHTVFLSSPDLLPIIHSGELAEKIIGGAPGQDILIDGLALTGSAALAIAHLPYTVTGL